MTEIMVHTLLDKSFSYSGSKFNNLQNQNDAKVSTVQNNESKKSFNKQMNAECDKNLESTECESDKSDAVLSDVRGIEVNVTKRSDNSSKELVQTKCNVSNEDYKVLSTKTTVINTTYNLISQSTREIMTTNMEHSTWPSFPNGMKEAVDKSRVIVQVLKSDLKSKSQNLNESKSSNPENQSVHSFRDDLYKLLSKSQSSKVDEGENSELFPGSDTLHVSDTFQDASSQSQDSKPYTTKTRRKHNLNFYFWNGRGAKVGDLKCVSENLRQASPASLRYLHYLMFNSFGLCGTALQLLKTKKNITSFCGYPFKRSSEQFQKKLKCIAKIPVPMLVGIHRAIFGKTSILNKSIMVDQVINFLWIPRKCSEILKKYDSKTKYMSEVEYAALKESALRGPSVFIELKRLPENYIRKYTNDHVNKNYVIPAYQSTDQDENTRIGSESSYTLPAYILNGPGTKLKYVPRIFHNVQTVHEEAIHLLHYILYGRMESSVKDSRRNILEFNGFSDCQQEFVTVRKDIIEKLNKRDLFELCKILCLRAKTSSREIRIKKILEYLQSPSKLDIKKPGKTSRWAVPISSRKGHLESRLSKRPSYKNVCKRRKFSSVYNSSESKVSRLSSPSVQSDCSDDDFTDNGDWMLRNFKTIFSNVECAAPCDLIELNDLLYLKTCDETDIHQKILDFPGFNFAVSSINYNSRKTLMHYMGFCIVRKIARLLNIENWDKISNPDDLSSNVLKFLMKKGEQDSPCSNLSSPSSFKSAKNNHLVSKPLSPPSPKYAIESSVVESSSPSSLFHTCSDTNPETPKSLESKFYEHANETFTHQKGKVIIQRLTKASVQTQEMCQSNESHDKSVQMFAGGKLNLLSINSSEDDSICLRDLIHHPSEQELKDLVYHLIKENLWCSTLGDLVQKVYACYPKVNLAYRENFIKAAARQIVSELRDYAVSTVKDQTF